MVIIHLCIVGEHPNMEKSRVLRGGLELVSSHNISLPSAEVNLVGGRTSLATEMSQDVF